MTPVDAIGFIPEGMTLPELAGPKANAASGSFANWLAQEVNSMNHLLQEAEVQVQRLATGEQDNLHQIMLSLEKTQMAFELVVQVRNRLLEGYQEIMRMQV